MWCRDDRSRERERERERERVCVCGGGGGGESEVGKEKGGERGGIRVWEALVSIITVHDCQVSAYALYEHMPSVPVYSLSVCVCVCACVCACANTSNPTISTPGHTQAHETLEVV